MSWNPLKWDWIVPVVMCAFGGMNIWSAIRAGEVTATGRGVAPHLIRYADDASSFWSMLVIWIIVFLCGIFFLLAPVFLPRKS
jgi:hypothetical protein